MQQRFLCEPIGSRRSLPFVDPPDGLREAKLGNPTRRQSIPGHHPAITLWVAGHERSNGEPIFLFQDGCVLAGGEESAEGMAWVAATPTIERVIISAAGACRRLMIEA
jgi:hypothetical protein